ncbi:YgjP-like metallopeptidase domain-containing protein [Vibrio salinus]|uniref:YgjP-like metallopeptidase domain-containing protein n=1 Tax=Vibrio salinus TaxID=2899784 RepID=UPI001E36FCB6|nr:M48 family metallopeptidase [Vibrio salinus]MCE0492399.1 M48 family metallopeptidase [Vibrio salinus]
MAMPDLKVIQGYPEPIVNQIRNMIENGSFLSWFEKRYPVMNHEIQNDKALYNYVMAFKSQYLKKAAPISKVQFDSKIHIINNALGLHSFHTKQHGNRIIRKNEIRIANLFKQAPEPLLKMLVVHELAHIKEKSHDKSFYQLCCHMEPEYHQLEFDARLFCIFKSIQDQ